MNGVTVYRPKPFPESISSADLTDSDLARYQLANWRYAQPKLTATGEVIDDPLKLLDDFGNLLQMWNVGNSLSGDTLTVEQKVDLLIPEPVKEALKTNKKINPIGARLDYDFHKEIAMNKLYPQREMDEWE